MNLMHLVTKQQTIIEGVTAWFIPYMSIRQTNTHREMSGMYGDIDKWPELALILWVCDAQTASIEVTSDAPETWRALAQYLRVAPQSLAERMRFYEFLPAELVQAWYTAYVEIQPKRDGDVPPKPDTTDPK